jgi:flagellar assembly protein FliH
MSTSSDFSWAATHAGIQSFEYPPAMPGLLDPKSGTSARHTAPAAAPDLQKQQLAAARQEGQREGELRAREIFEESLRAARQKLQATLEQFENERHDYFCRVETEVVQLSLSIARKVLHREAQVDKQLLGGVVRAMVSQLADTTGIVLRVHPSQQQEWTSFFAASELDPAPQVVADAAVDADRCFLSTPLGTTEIGIESQLKEIENGLLDLLAQRPGV